MHFIIFFANIVFFMEKNCDKVMFLQIVYLN